MFNLRALLVFYLSFSFTNLNSTSSLECGAPFHGIIEHDIVCEEEVLITSFPEDFHGTVVLSSMSFKGRLRIKPGAHSVKLLPKRDLSLTEKQRRTKFKNDNRTRKDPDIETSDVQIIDVETPDNLDFIFTNHYIGINNLTVPIVYYGFYNLQRQVVIEMDQEQALDYHIPTTNLESGIYILDVILKNGREYTETFGKQ